MARVVRVAATVMWLLVTETLVVGIAVLPAAVAWGLLLQRPGLSGVAKAAVMAATLVPAIVVSALLLLALSALACRLMRWRTPPGAVLVIADLEWPLLRWVCYASCTHVATLLVGSWLRASPVWTWFLRANGARIGHGVYVNTLGIYDHNLLEFGDRSVIGSGVHLSGHTVEHGSVTTGYVRLGPGAVIGVGAVVAVDVEIGAGTHVAALSFVPKHARLAPGEAYGGIPVRPLEQVSSGHGG